MGSIPSNPGRYRPMRGANPRPHDTGDPGLREREGTREKMQRPDGPVTGRRTETGDYIKGNAGGETTASG